MFLVHHTQVEEPIKSPQRIAHCDTDLYLCVCVCVCVCVQGVGGMLGVMMITISSLGLWLARSYGMASGWGDMESPML
jgi:hypothetical protein